MCLGIAGRIVEVGAGATATVDFGGVRRDVSVAFTPGVAPGQWVLVHVGFALSTVDEQEAQATLRLLREAIDAELEAAQ